MRRGKDYKVVRQMEKESFDLPGYLPRIKHAADPGTWNEGGGWSPERERSLLFLEEASEGFKRPLLNMTGLWYHRQRAAE